MTGDFEAAQRIFFLLEKGKTEKKPVAGCFQICRLGAVEKKKAISSTETDYKYLEGSLLIYEVYNVPFFVSRAVQPSRTIFIPLAARIFHVRETVGGALKTRAPRVSAREISARSL